MPVLSGVGYFAVSIVCRQGRAPHFFSPPRPAAATVRRARARTRHGSLGKTLGAGGVDGFFLIR